MKEGKKKRRKKEKEARKTGREEERKTGRKEGRKKGRTEERKRKKEKTKLINEKMRGAAHTSHSDPRVAPDGCNFQLSA